MSVSQADGVLQGTHVEATHTTKMMHSTALPRTKAPTKTSAIEPRLAVAGVENSQLRIDPNLSWSRTNKMMLATRRTGLNIYEEKRVSRLLASSCGRRARHVPSWPASGSRRGSRCQPG